MELEQNPVIEKLLNYAKNKNIISWEEISAFVGEEFFKSPEMEKVFQLLTQNNIVRNFSSVLTLSIYKDNHDLLFKNLLSSLSMLFKTDTMIFEAKCPVCGSSDLTYDGFTYKCSKCGSTYSLLNIDNEEILWVKSFRR